jgi:hypothetical protein
LERGEAPLLYIPLPFTNPQGKGVRGMGLNAIEKMKQIIYAANLSELAQDGWWWP